MLLIGAGTAAYLTRTRPLLGETCVAVVGENSYDLEPDQARNAATIAAIAVQRGLPARAASIAIATAIQESKLRNLDYGDRDSLGLFQQRPSQGWGTEQQIMDPIYATNAFYDALVKIKGYESMVITEVAQKVQRSAFPDAYGFHEDEARAYASALTGHSPGDLTCRLAEAGSTATGQAATDAVWQSVQQEFQAGTRESGAGGTLVIRTADATHAWSLASWAVASAADLQITAVQVGGQGWQRGKDADWSADSEAPSQASRLVRITVG